ncbi:FHA domain-containing protein [Pendulispora albinea]|uniref:FHA domain-containing protein n=1 Tax=Pendulispora albinea TaxID=2741071 RepID=A0ABZ2LX08_9BACT
MSSDPNKKSGRTFQCRDVLWETFEQMARELECSVDYLINEAMKQYARQRSYGAQGTRPQFPSSPTRDSAPVPSDRGGGYPPPPPPPRAGGLPPPPARPQRQAPGPLPPPPQQAARGPGMQHGGQHGGLPAPPQRGPSGPIPAAPRSVPPPARSVPPPIPRGNVPNAMGGGGGMASPMGMASNGYPPTHGAPQLCVMYQGEKIPVNKERFVIGRGKQSSDLTLKDPNVSRQHAMIEFQNGIYFMVDMGSTNGVEFNGQRIARKQIAEGDHFKICDHDLRFTYR